MLEEVRNEETLQEEGGNEGIDFEVGEEDEDEEVDVEMVDNNNYNNEVIFLEVIIIESTDEYKILIIDSIQFHMFFCRSISFFK